MRMTNRRGRVPPGARRVGLLSMVLALTGCTLLIEEPQVRVVDVQAASIGLRGGTLTVLVEVENPNRFGLQSEVFSYRLDLAEQPGDESTEWRTLFDGAYEGLVEIPAHESARVEVDVPFEYGTVGVVVGRLLRQGELEYRFSGSLQFPLPVGNVQVPFDERGTFRP